MVAIGVALISPSYASAVFTRDFDRQITGTCEKKDEPTPSCPGSKFVPFRGFAGRDAVAVDSLGDLWVGDGSTPPFSLDEFGSAGAGNPFSKTLGIEGTPNEIEPKPGEKIDFGLTPPESLAIDNATSEFYNTATATVKGAQPSVEVFDDEGHFVRRWGPLELSAHVTVDNSTDPFDVGAGSVYVVTGSNLGGEVLTKYNTEGKEEEFEALHSSKIVVGAAGHEPSIVVDPEGDIFVTGEDAVLEYGPSGELVRVLGGEETPGVPGVVEEHDEFDGFGGVIRGVAFDPVSNHVLVAADGESQEVHVGVVDEFEAATGKYLSQIVQTTRGVGLQAPRAMAVDPEGYLYVVDEHAVDVFAPGRFLPSVRLGEASGVARGTAVLSGSVNPEGFDLSGCEFQYVPQKQFEAEKGAFTGVTAGEEAACEPSASEISGKPLHGTYPVHATVTGLVSGVTYYYRLVATSEGALGGVGESEPLAFTALHAPEVRSTSAGDLSSSFAELRAQVAPLGSDTSYYFEYGLTTGYGQDAPVLSAQAPEGVSVGSGGPTGGAVEAVAQHIGQLAPGSEYHFRLVAQSVIEGREEVSYGPDETFTTLPEPAVGLPDGRAYELVTPADKQGGSDMFAEPEINGEFFNTSTDGLPAESGDGFLLETFSAFGSFPTSAGSNVYVLSREPERNEWGFVPVASRSLGVQQLVSASVIFTPDLSRVGLSDRVGAEVSEGGVRMVDLVGPPGAPGLCTGAVSVEAAVTDDCYIEVHKDPVTYSRETVGTEIVGASQDLTHVVLAAGSNLGEGGLCGEDTTLCEWSGDYETLPDGEAKPVLAPVDVTPEGSVSRCPATLGAGEAAGLSHDAVSADGSRVIFTMSPSPPACRVPAQLYMRSHGKTIELSEPEEGVEDPTGQHYALYAGASEDDSKVFFVTETELTHEAQELELHDRELYECEIVEEHEGEPKCKLTRISAGEPGSPGSVTGAAVSTVPAVSAEGNAVYYTSPAELAPGAKPGLDLYSYQTATAKTTFVATVTSYDYPAGGKSECADDGPASVLCSYANWYTTPDGRYLLFATPSEITGYGTAGCSTLPLTGGVGDGHCDELYRYDAELPVSEGQPGVTDNPVCVSCDPSGVPPVSNAQFARSVLATPSSGAVRALSDDGSCAFFDSADPLVPGASNKTLDVYEWEAYGAGRCEPSPPGVNTCGLLQGCIYLISSGEDSAPSYFLGASPDGHDVFFGTHARLVPQDTDSLGDVYDARVCEPENGDPCLQPPRGETAQCEGGSCQTPPPLALFQTPATLTLSSSGNVVAKPLSPSTGGGKCKKGFVKKKVKGKEKCVKKPKAKSKKARKTSRKRGG